MCGKVPFDFIVSKNLSSVFFNFSCSSGIRAGKAESAETRSGSGCSWRLWETPSSSLGRGKLVRSRLGTGRSLRAFSTVAASSAQLSRYGHQAPTFYERPESDPQESPKTRKKRDGLQLSI